MRILVVEDDQLLNKTLSYNLSAVGYSVDGAMSKAVAIRFLEKQDYDLIVLDVNLPDGNGFDICREVKERRPDTAVIFLTANDMESDMLKGFELGADDYVTKPFPISVFQKKVSALVSFPFNVVDGMEADMEEFLSSYVEDIEPSMNYDSKQTYINSFNDLTSLIITIGGALSIIIGLIGITNFVNSVLTSIITRRKELAMLQSIGMTGKQLKKMLSFEGLYYAAGTVVASIVFGSLVSVIIVRAISNSIWFFTYKFVIFPMFVIYPFLIALTVIIPAIIYRKIAKTSIIERLHQN